MSCRRSVVRFIRLAPERIGPPRLAWPGASSALLLDTMDLPRQFEASRLIRDFTVPSGSRAGRRSPGRTARDVAQHDGRRQRWAAGAPWPSQQGPLVVALELRVGARLVRCRRHLPRVELAVDGLPLLANAPVVVDAQVAADADEPGLEVGPPVERVERRKIFRKMSWVRSSALLVPADELVGHVEDLAPVQADDGLPGGLVAGQTALDQLVGRGRRYGGGIGGIGARVDGAECAA